jgi:lipopolysaccharide export system permease protein
MKVLGRYLFRQTGLVFLGALLVLTGVVWITQALRQFDLVTAQGQTLWTFVIITGLALPSLALVVAPVALFGAIAYTLNRLNADSEMAAITASGAAPLQVMRPFLTLAVIVSIVVGILSLSAIPASLRVLRDMVTQIRADVVVNVLREGTFTTLDEGITLHMRARGNGGALLGLFVEDNRNPAQRLAYIAEQGRVVETDEGTFLVLEKGSVQRQTPNDVTAIVVFERYAFDLSPLAEAAQGAVTSYKPRERYLSELWSPDETDAVVKAVPGRFRSELHERLVNPLYPLSFMMIAFAALGRARTNRQNRFKSLGIAIACVFAVRMAGLGVTNLVANASWAVPLLYAVPLGAIVISFGLAAGWFDGLGARKRLQQAAL